MDTSITFRRDDLYEQVWCMPMQRLARRYGLSDVALGKICRKLGIPLPGRGHWAKLAAGHEMIRSPLPPLKEGQVSEYSVEQANTRGPDATEEYAALKTQVGPVLVAQRLARPHPFVEATQRILNGAIPHDGRFRPRTNALDIRVSPKNLSRALRIMDALLKSLEKQGISVSTAGAYKGETVAIIEGEEVAFDMSEGLTRTKRTPDRYDLERLKRDPNAEIYPRWDYNPSGQLKLRIKEYIDVCQKEWSDGKKHRLEDKLSSFIVGLMITGKAKRKRHEEWERKRREEEEARQREERLRAKQEEERRRVEELFDHVERWERADALRRFVAAARQSALQKYGNIEPGSELDRWINWALSIAEQTDPLGQFRTAGP